METKNRNSNLELFRILTMFAIIIHHYVVNSGLMDASGPIYSNLSSPKSIIYLILGAWGKTGINCFVFITGYFMCKSNITLKKFLKLFLQIMFYRLVITSVFWISGYSAFSIKSFLLTIIPIYTLKSNFTACFLIFYLFIPFLNVLVNNLSEKQHICLMILAFFSYTVIGTLHMVSFNYVTWFSVLYLFSSYIRLYPKKIFDSKKFWLTSSCLSIVFSIISIFGMIFIDTRYNKLLDPYFFVCDSNTFLAFTNGLSLFMLFKNLNIKQNKIINTVASTTFGVFLIHTLGDSMRKFLWQDLLHNKEMYASSMCFLHLFLSAAGIFVVCSLIDLLRIKFIEKPVFKLIGRKEEKINNSFDKILDKFILKTK